jgi:fatty-acid desaturase
MAFLDRVLETPSYGFTRNDALYVPTKAELLRELASRLNVFKTVKNWLPAWSWFTSTVLLVPLVVFATQYFSWWLVALGFVYSMVGLGTHGTVYLHRYATHRGFTFTNAFSRFIVRNLVIKIVTEEAYVVSHHVHHHISEQPGDPYNVHGGFLYCFLADANHQLVARDLDPKQYQRLTQLMTHTGVRINSYAQYQRWGSICHPLATAGHFALNWAFWYAAFFAVGGHALATAMFGASAVWAIGIRTYNYDGHGGGKDKRVDGVDFNRDDLSINQIWPGYVAGEWHNNHHLYPNGARSGFLPYQLDLAWIFIRGYAAIGGINSFRDHKQQFLRDHYEPWLARKNAAALGSAPVEDIQELEKVESAG